MTSWRERTTNEAESILRSRERFLDKAENIVQACRALYYETNGLDFTIQDLATKAGIAIQTFYRYFRSKDELLLAVLEDVLRESSGRIAAAVEGVDAPLRRLELLVKMPILMSGDSAPVYARLLVSEHLRLERLYPREVEDAQACVLIPLVQAIEDATAAGEISRRASPSRDARVIMSVMRSVYHRLALGVTDHEASTVADHLWLFSLGALSAGATESCQRSVSERSAGSTS